MSATLSSLADEIANKDAVRYLMQELDPEERDILYLWLVEERTFSEIGRIVGLRYRGRVLTASAARYHKDRIRAKLRHHAAALGFAR